MPGWKRFCGLQIREKLTLRYLMQREETACMIFCTGNGGKEMN